MSSIIIVLLVIFIIVCVISARKELKKVGGYENYKKLYHPDKVKNNAPYSKQYTIEYDGRAETGQQYPFNIVGEASYQKNIAKLAVLRGDRDCFTEIKATIKREPTNIYDKNACRVDINGITVGYFARNHAESWINLLEKLNMPENSSVNVNAVIVGGAEGRQFGVRLDMPYRISNVAKYLVEME